MRLTKHGKIMTRPDIARGVKRLWSNEKYRKMMIRKLRGRKMPKWPKDRRQRHKAIMKEIGNRPGIKRIRSFNSKLLHKNRSFNKRHSAAMRRAWNRNRKAWSLKIKRSKNKHQLSVVRSLRGQGWTIIHRGWPDFICLKEKEIKFVEAKGIREKVRDEQQAVHAILALFGIKVEIIRPKVKL